MALKNSRVREIPFTLTPEEFSLIVDRAAGKCELSGIEFRRKSKYSRNPWAPSLDRIDSKLSYTFENCRLLCAAANIALNVWDVSVLLKITDGIRVSFRRRREELPISVVEPDPVRPICDCGKPLHRGQCFQRSARVRMAKKNGKRVDVPGGFGTPKEAAEARASVG